MRSIHLIISVTLLLTVLRPAHAQDNQAVREAVESYMQTIREKGYSPLTPDVLKKTNDMEALLREIEPFTRDSLQKIRYGAYYLFYRTGSKSSDREYKTEAVHHLLAGCKDEAISLRGNCAKWLTVFYKDDFNAEAHTQLFQLLRQSTGHYDKLLLLAGYVQPPGIKDSMKIHLQQRKLPNKTQWAAYLALARSGDPEAIRYIKEKAGSLQVNDAYMYVLLPDLIYTRQKELFDNLIAILMSDEKNCRSADPDHEVPILCGYRVMEALAPVIADFPVPTDQDGDIVSDDYPEALKKCREYFRTNLNYTIKTNRY